MGNTLPWGGGAWGLGLQGYAATRPRGHEATTTKGPKASRRPGDGTSQQADLRLPPAEEAHREDEGDGEPAQQCHHLGPEHDHRDTL